jgi:hypothetical protein
MLKTGLKKRYLVWGGIALLLAFALVPITIAKADDVNIRVNGKTTIIDDDGEVYIESTADQKTADRLSRHRQRVNENSSDDRIYADKYDDDDYDDDDYEICGAIFGKA